MMLGQTGNAALCSRHNLFACPTPLPQPRRCPLSTQMSALMSYVCLLHMNENCSVVAAAVCVCVFVLYMCVLLRSFRSKLVCTQLARLQPRLLCPSTPPTSSPQRAVSFVRVAFDCLCRRYFFLSVLSNKNNNNNSNTHTYTHTHAQHCRH